jgi:hypothetical protein
VSVCLLIATSQRAVELIKAEKFIPYVLRLVQLIPWWLTQIVVSSQELGYTYQLVQNLSANCTLEESGLNSHE